IMTGVLTYKQGGKEENLMVNGGFCEVSDNKITFLAESAERGKEIDVNRAMLAKERAEKRIAQAQQKKEGIDLARAEGALQRALARLKLGKS
ncbi:MAG: F0F1 ATP synthase subunit epsilon, partial [Desulfobulbaceae bacterium]|nr:F0F1 ATP synthase subunit epsilon [Desulfobulbaceae bacterium]